jgi:hypothetical protein
MRARNIKPGYFKNEELADCDPLARILFSGLWCLADREGRLEYRPRKIKAEVLPYDNCNIDKLIKQLSDKEFILVYMVNNNNYIQILKFNKHQNPHVKELESSIPEPNQHQINTVFKQDFPESTVLIPDSPSLIPDSPSLKEYSDEFLIFWKNYPSKVEKKYAYKCWKKLNGNRPDIEIIISSIKKQIEWREKSNGEFRPEWKNPATWLNKGCWDDELKAPHPLSGKVSDKTIQNIEMLKEWEPANERQNKI